MIRNQISSAFICWENVRFMGYLILLTSLPAMVWGNDNSNYPDREERVVSSWVVRIDPELVRTNPELVERSMKSLKLCLEEIQQVLPADAIKKLTSVPLYVSRPYPGTGPKAEYHPSSDWLIKNGRDPKMAKAVEFTNLEIFDDELIRMPWFVLHELAHAYHDQHLPDGFSNPTVNESFLRAKAAGTYDTVERKLGRNRDNLFEPAYALTNPMEFFAESTESYFGTNDFAPFNREELEVMDPKTSEMIQKMWGVSEKSQSKTK